MSVEISTLKQLYPLETMREEHLRFLAEEAGQRDLKRRDVLFREGENDGRTFYLLAGKLHAVYSDGREREFDANSVSARHAIADSQPRRCTARVISASARLLSFDRAFLDKVLTWDQVSRNDPSLRSNEDSRWVFEMLRSKALQKLSAGNVQRMFERFDELEVRANETVIREGDAGEHFYVIKVGQAEVLKADGDGTQRVAVLGPGQSFGEDALISNEPRNASVIMKTGGRLMRLGKGDFGKLLKYPVVEWLSPGQASVLVRKGARLLDVRLPEEFEEQAIRSAVNIPLAQLRERIGEHAKPNQRVVVYCDSGERSASAAFILSKLDYEVYAINGGLAAVRRAATAQDSASAVRTESASAT